VESRRIARRYALDVPDRATPGSRAWRARDEHTGGAVLVVVLDDGPTADATLAGLGRMRHLALPVVLDHGADEDGSRYVVTPLPAGAPARAGLRSGLAGADLARFGAELADLLAALHGDGLVQGSLSLDELVLDAAGRPRLERLATAGLARPPSRPDDDLRALSALLRELAGAAPEADLLAVPGMPPRLGALLMALASAAPPDARSASGALRRIADTVGRDPLEPFTDLPVAPSGPGGGRRRRGLQVLVAVLFVGVAALGAIALAEVIDRRDAEQRAAQGLPGPVTTVAPTATATTPLVLPTATTETVETVEPATADPSAPRRVQRIAIADVEAIDPGGDRVENGDQARRAIDRSPISAWRTEEYKAADLGGKDGIGLVLRLEVPARVTAVRLRALPQGATVQLFTVRGSVPETAPRGWTPLGEPTTLRRVRTTLRVERRRSATTLLVWITELPGPPGAHFVEIADVRVLGYPRGA